MTNERLHDLDTILTKEEIEELKNLCYENGNSWCPISDFFNDIERNTDTNYNKNQAYKDLWLIVNIILSKSNKEKAFDIMLENNVDLSILRRSRTCEEYNRQSYRRLSQEHFNFLKEQIR